MQATDKWNAAAYLRAGGNCLRGWVLLLIGTSIYYQKQYLHPRPQDQLTVCRTCGQHATHLAILRAEPAATRWELATLRWQGLQRKFHCAKSSEYKLHPDDRKPTWGKGSLSPNVIPPINYPMCQTPEAAPLLTSVALWKVGLVGLSAPRPTKGSLVIMLQAMQTAPIPAVQFGWLTMAHPFLYCW